MIKHQMISKMAAMRGITQVEQWTHVYPHEVLRLEKVGLKSLDMLRLWLAAQGLTLRDDATPQAWIAALRQDAPIPSDFTIVIDNQEKHPFRFEQIFWDAERDYRSMLVQTKVASLGATHADYSVLGYEDQCAIERKSLEDAIGTFAGGSERRDRFERELAYLSQLKCSAVVIECTRGELYASAQSRGVRSDKQLAKSLCRTVLAWEQDYRVPFVFSDTREQAEQECFRLLQRFHKHATSIQSLVEAL